MRQAHFARAAGSRGLPRVDHAAWDLFAAATVLPGIDPFQDHGALNQRSEQSPDRAYVHHDYSLTAFDS